MNYKVSVVFICHAALFYVVLFQVHAEATTLRATPEQEAQRELLALANAIESFRHFNGYLPPAFATDSLNRDVRLEKYFVENQLPKHRFDVGIPAGLKMSDLDPAETLVFFLGDIPFNSAILQTPARALKESPPLENPQQETMIPKAVALSSHFSFETKRLVDRDRDGFWEYLPPNSITPYVYFPSSEYGASYNDPSNPNAGIAVAYKKLKAEWYRGGHFQIINAGKDGIFGKTKDRIYPGEIGFTRGDYDNQTNFLAASFSKLLLREKIDAGSGKLLNAVAHLVALICFPLMWLAWRRSFRISVRQLLIAVSIISCLLGIAMWDVRSFGSSQRAFGWLFEASFRTIVVAFALSCLVTFTLQTKVTNQRVLDK